MDKQDEQPAEFADFEAFWRHFLSSHTDPLVRACHVAGLLCGALGLFEALRRRRLWPLLLGGGAFAGLAILSHPLLTGHWPENLGHPLWGARALLRLCARTLDGSIDKEVAEMEAAGRAAN